MWRPNPRVTIGGTEFTDYAIGQVTFTKGRQSIYERPNAGFATVELIDVDGIPTFRVGQELQVEIDFADYLWSGMASTWAAVGSTWDDVADVSFVSQPVFTGTVSDWQSQVTPTRDEPLIVYRVQAIGPLATLNRRQIYFAGRTAENDAERVLNVLQTALGTAAVDPDLIDDGVFDIAAIGSADAGYNALQVAQDAGFSGEGLLFETADGKIGYADADRRLENERAGVLEIPFGSLSADGIGLLQQLADITNDVTVTYDGGAVQDEDTSSKATFGEYATRIDTQLVNLSNAEARAFQFLQRHSGPRTVLESLSFNLLGTDEDLRNALLNVGPSDAISVEDIPARLGFSRFRGFVEGFTLSATPFAARLTFLVSDRRLSIGAQRWEQVLDTIRWQDVNPTLAWEDATEVTT